MPASYFAFSDLYGTQLNIELSSSDTTQLFTTAKRKQAVNDAMVEFVRLTRCCVRYGTIAIVDGTGEYDVFTNFSDYIRLADDAPSIKIVKSGVDDQYIQGPDDFPRRTTGELDVLEPGWRGVDASTPAQWYLRVTDGHTYFGMHPAPDVGSGETWTVLFPYVAKPTAMSADADEPFTVNNVVHDELGPYQQALVHGAAYRLEALRKNYSGVDRQRANFAGYIADYLRAERQDGPNEITMTRDYFGQARQTDRPPDPRRWP